jgi:hypothetical protein
MKDQIERLAALDQKLSGGSTVRDQEETPVLIVGAWTKRYAVDLFTLQRPVRTVITRG